MGMKTKYAVLMVGSLLQLTGIREALAVDGPLPLCYAPQGVAINSGFTTQVISSSYGNNPMGLAFTGTTTYDFYSSPLTADVALQTSDEGLGIIFMQNANPTSANDFQATGEMRYYDYNPFTGTDTLIVDTGISGKDNVQHGSTTHWNMNPVSLPANYTMPMGDLLHVAVTITVVSGNPGTGAQVLYNGSAGSTTIADITYPASGNFIQLAWPFPSSSIASWPNVSLGYSPDPAVQVRFYGTPGTNYLIQATSNLGDPSSWATIGTSVAGGNGFLSYIDNDVTNYPSRFYRAVTQ
jgi:hypothetical protein